MPLFKAEKGEVVDRPLGAAKKKSVGFDSITCIGTQTTPFPIDSEEPVDLTVTTGPKVKRPLQIKTPLLISGMAYGVALIEKAKIALAKAAIKVGTAMGGRVGPENLQGRAREIMGLEDGEG